MITVVMNNGTIDTWGNDAHIKYDKNAMCFLIKRRKKTLGVYNPAYIEKIIRVPPLDAEKHQ